MGAEESGGNLLAVIVWGLSPSPRRTTQIAMWLSCGPKKNMMVVHARCAAFGLLDIVKMAKIGRESDLDAYQMWLILLIMIMSK